MKISFLIGTLWLIGGSPLWAQNPQPPPHNAPESAAFLKTCETPGDPKLYQQQLPHYQQAVVDDPQNPYKHYNLGYLYFRLKQWKEAESAFLQARQHDTKKVLTAPIEHNLGNVYACQQQFAKAVERYRKATLAQPQDEETRYNLALTQKLAEQQKQQQQQGQDKQQEEGKNQNTAQQQQSEKGKQEQNSEAGKQQEQKAQNSSEASANKSPQSSNATPVNPDSLKSPSEQAAESSEKDTKKPEKAGIAAASSKENSAKNSQDLQARISRSQAEQLLNAVPENRRKYVQQMLRRQMDPAQESGKNW